MFNRNKKREKDKKKNYPEYIGTVRMTREGYAFILVDELEEDIFVKASRTKGALNGDSVRVAVIKESMEGRRMEGDIKEILERSIKPFIGVLHIVGDKAWVLMQSRVMPLF